jgi:outer membrane protein assembly factor BamB
MQWQFLVACAQAVLGGALWLAAVAPAAVASERATARLIASPEPDWPQWRGPNRDGVSPETGLLQQWPEDGAKLLWKASGLGRGYCAPIVVGNRIYLTGDVGDELHIFALDLQGQRVWQTQNGRAWTGPYPGARASCTYSESRLYHLNAHGRVACLDTATGAELWAVDVLARFGGRNITWALSECLLVDGPRVIVTAGGTNALLAALDKKTGATVWSSKPLFLGTLDDPARKRLAEPAGEVDRASYASPILFKLGDRRHLVNCSLRHVFGADADTGELLWTRPLPTRYSVITATPVLVGDAVFVTAPDGEGGALYRIHPQGTRVHIETVWTTKLDTCQGGFVHRDGALYGSWYRQEKGWVCLDARTGAVRYQTQDLAKGSVLYADGHLYCLSEEGEMALLKPTPQGFEFAGRFRLVPERTRDAWTHPVILNHRLYLRFHDTLFCYDIRRK